MYPPASRISNEAMSVPSGWRTVNPGHHVVLSGMKRSSFPSSGRCAVIFLRHCPRARDLPSCGGTARRPSRRQRAGSVLRRRPRREGGPLVAACCAQRTRTSPALGINLEEILLQCPQREFSQSTGPVLSGKLSLSRNSVAVSTARIS